MSGGPLIALVGNPNSGKSTLFNRLTGLRQHVANYPGVTVERRIGTTLLPDGRVASVVDLPGVRSLAPRSPDERIAVDVLLGRRRAMAIPDVTVVVLNALHLDVSLYLLFQVRDLGVPVIAALNVADEAEAAGVKIDLPALERETGVRIVRTVATRGEGLDELRALMAAPPAAPPAAALPGPIHDACTRLRAACTGPATDAELAAAMLEGEGAEGLPEPVRKLAVEEGAKLRAAGIDLLDALVVSTHRRVATATAAAQDRRGVDARGRWTRRLDAVLTHPVGGYAAFLGLMTFIFWMMFSISEHPMGWIESGFAALAGAARRLPPGLLTDLLADGVIAGVGSVVVFLPQILLIFLFLGILEDSGYMARAVLLLDRPLSAAGLSGRAFVPLLGSTACAVPGVMATRVIPDGRERLAAILVAPLMTCSARLPVYAVFIGLLIPQAWIGALVLAGLYALGVVSALIVAKVFRLTSLRGSRRDFMVELPPYRWPGLGTTGIQLWHRVRAFLLRAGTVIVGITVILWFLSTFPRVPDASASEQLEGSIAGRVGKFVEPAIRPLGFDWKAGIGILTSFFSARETFVATMGTVYSVENAAEDNAPLRERMRQDRHPKTGRPVWTLASGLSMMVFYVFAMLCSATVVTVAKEAGGWKWALLQLGFMSALAYVAAWGTYRAAMSAGWGA